LGAPINLKSEVNELNFRGLALVYVIIKKEKALNDNWIFFPEKNFIFQRISEQKSFSAFNQPKDKSVIVAEISLRPEILKMSDRELQEKVVGDLQKAGLIRGNEVESSFTLRKDNVYPIYLLGYKRHLNLILKWIDNNATNFITCGRNGLFNYNNMDHCIDMAIKIAEHLKTKESVEDMSKLRKYFETYKIVD
jgi:protoporphyrinogen oxidase